MAQTLAAHLPSWLAHLLVALLQCGLLLLVPFLGAMTFVWMERKISGRIQDRLGPTRTGGRFGWLQLLADGIKLVCKEDIKPKQSDWLLFTVAPYVSFAATYVALMALPFSNGWVAVRLDISAFFILAVLGIGVFGIVLGGYASGSKWSLFGAMREAAQVVSYEVPMGICVVVPAMTCGTLDLVDIGNMQAGGAHRWLVFHDPATFVIAAVYFTCAMASCSRARFDLAEAESELVAGFHTEYSGFRWLAFYMAEYGQMFVVSGLAAILFFGGWNGPIPIAQSIASALGGALQWFTANDVTALVEYVANLLGCLNFILKGFLGVTLMIWVRWTLPRLRIDQVITTCLKYCTPIAAAMFVVAVWWNLCVPGAVRRLDAKATSSCSGESSQSPPASGLPPRPQR